MTLNGLLGTLTCLAATVLASPGHAASPAQLHGKSVVVSYVNTTSLRAAGTQGTYYTTNTSRRIDVYINSAGRPFMRAGKTSTPELEQVGASGSNSTGGATTLQFQGHSLIVGFGYVNGATRAKIDFSADFRSCTATVAHGKAGGSGSYIFKDGAETFEIQSSTANNISCSLTDGNALSN